MIIKFKKLCTTKHRRFIIINLLKCDKSSISDKIKMQFFKNKVSHLNLSHILDSSQLVNQSSISP